MKSKQITINIIALFAIVFTLDSNTFSQEEYKANEKNPFGTLSPNAPKQVADYRDLIGISDCKSRQRGADGNFKAPVDSVWQFKYILNGTAIQDETWKSDGTHTSSIRQFNEKKSEWYVTFFASNSTNPRPPVWSGNKDKKGDIILTKSQKAPNGMDGFSKLTFYEISKNGFKWKGEWVDPKETIKFPFWTIECKKRAGS